MGTAVTITVAAPESPQALAAIEAAFAEIARLARIFADDRPGSDVAAIGEHAGASPIKVTPEVFRVLEQAKGISEQSGGAFDVTCGALMGLWDYHAPTPRVPSHDELQARVALVGYHRLALDRAQGTARLTERGMRLTLGGIAKGAIVEQASGTLTARGYPNHVVAAGGDLYVSGLRGDARWKVGIIDPRTKTECAQIEVSNEAVSTSGNYERFFMAGGVRYHHILDPRTGMPARGLSQVTVVAPTGALADGSSTTIFVLGRDKGLAFAQAHGLDVLMLDEQYVPTATPRMRARLGGAVGCGASAKSQQDGDGARDRDGHEQ